MSIRTNVLNAIRDFNVHQEAAEYEWRGDGDYTPNDHERAMLEDFGNGLMSRLADMVEEKSHFTISPKISADEVRKLISEGKLFSDADPEARFVSDAENACPHCGGSGHRDDVHLFTPTK